MRHSCKGNSMIGWKKSQTFKVYNRNSNRASLHEEAYGMKRWINVRSYKISSQGWKVWFFKKFPVGNGNQLESFWAGQWRDKNCALEILL